MRHASSKPMALRPALALQSCRCGQPLRIVLHRRTIVMIAL
ncbi:hypothetical protein XPU_0869, partial [Xanthomonas arboricola pv. pruni str. MAFF 311562]